jgi:hypothetical protein
MVLLRAWRLAAVLNLDVVAAASGSAYLEFRDTKVICSVYDLRLAHPARNPGPSAGEDPFLTHCFLSPRAQSLALFQNPSHAHTSDTQPNSNPLALVRNPGCEEPDVESGRSP